VAVASADPWAARLGEWVALQQRRAVVSVDPIWEGLVAYYPLNSNANDETIYASHGTVGAGASFTNAVPFAAAGGSANFNNTANSFIDLGVGWRPDDVPQAVAEAIGLRADGAEWNSTNLTMSVWVYIRNRTTYGGIFNIRASNLFGLVQDTTASQKIYRGIYGYAENFTFGGGSDGVANSTTPTGEWFHIAMTAERIGTSGNTLTLKTYINGSESDSTGFPFGGRFFYSGLTSNNFFRLGQDRATTTRRTDGMMSEASLWHRTLSSNEVSRLYNEQLIYRKP